MSFIEFIIVLSFLWGIQLINDTIAWPTLGRALDTLLVSHGEKVMQQVNRMFAYILVYTFIGTAMHGLSWMIVYQQTGSGWGAWWTVVIISSIYGSTYMMDYLINHVFRDTMPLSLMRMMDRPIGLSIVLGGIGVVVGAAGVVATLAADWIVTTLDVAAMTMINIIVLQISHYVPTRGKARLWMVAGVNTIIGVSVGMIWLLLMQSGFVPAMAAGFAVIGLPMTIVGTIRNMK